MIYYCVVFILYLIAYCDVYLLDSFSNIAIVIVINFFIEFLKEFFSFFLIRIGMCINIAIQRSSVDICQTS